MQQGAAGLRAETLAAGDARLAGVRAHVTASNADARRGAVEAAAGGERSPALQVFTSADIRPVHTRLLNEKLRAAVFYRRIYRCRGKLRELMRDEGVTA